MSQPIKQNVKPAPLGRGLSALFGDADASYQAKPLQPKTAAPAAAPPDRNFRMMPVAWLLPGAYQPRRYFDETRLKELAESIKERGVLEPLIVRPMQGSRSGEVFEIVAGERRWRAAQLAGVHEVPVIVRQLTDLEALEFGLIENVQRQDLSPLEEAEGYQRLIGEFSYTQDYLAKIVGKSRPHVTNMLRILTLPQAVKQMIEDGDITLGHARALVTAKNPMALAEEIVRKGLNVRQAENLAKDHGAKSHAPKKVEQPTENHDVQMLEKELERVIGLKVKIKTEGKAGSLTLYYKDLDQLDDIIKKLRG